jgi:hypothetical protein
VGDPKRENGPARPRRSAADDVPARPPDAWAADLINDLKQTEPDFEITEYQPDEVSAANPLDPNAFEARILEQIDDSQSDEATLRIETMQRHPALPMPEPATIETPQRTRPPIEGGSLQEVGPTMTSAPEIYARTITPIPAPQRRTSSVPRRQPTPAPQVKLSLPCNVLVVDDDRRSGAQAGARLMEAGCSCRAVTVEEASSVLDHTYHVVLLEVPAAEARSDCGHDRITRIAPWKGPLVLASAAVIDPLPNAAGASVTKPYFIEDLITAIETARRKAQPRGASRVEILDPVEAIAHHDLDSNIVRAMLVRTEGQVSRGRVRTMSYDGELLVSMNQPPKRGMDVGVELTLADGRRMEIGGKVGTSSGTEMEIALKLGDNERLFLRHFLDQARDVTQAFVEQVRIRQKDISSANNAIVSEASLDRMWQEAAAKLDDDELQQRFIQACLKAQKLEHAVKCYRTLKQERPGDERVAKYLQQVGTILGFYAFKKEPQVKDEAKLPMAVKIAMGLFLAAALILWIMLVVMR